jgi:hypothetical protein
MEASNLLCSCGAGTIFGPPILLDQFSRCKLFLLQDCKLLTVVAKIGAIDTAITDGLAPLQTD